MTSHSYGKVSVNSLGGFVNWVGQSLRASLGRGKPCSQVDIVSDMGTCLPALRLWGGGGGGKAQERDNGFSVWEKRLPISRFKARPFTSSLYATGAFQAASPVLELGGVSMNRWVHM